MFECTEGNTEVSDKEGEFAEALAVSETYSCYTLLPTGESLQRDAIIKVDTEQ